MPAANTPQAPATRRSRRRSGEWWLGAFMSIEFNRFLQRAVQHAGAFHERDDVEQDDQGSERQRDRDRARAPAALLLFRERDSVGLFSHVIYQPPHVAAWTSRADNPRSIRSTAKSANR